jgi:hypothetical protein
VPESAAVVSIGEHERKVDQLLKRRRLEVQSAISSEPPLRKMVRVYITHRYAHQAGGEGDGDDANGAAAAVREPPQWSVHLSGRVDPDVPADHVTAVALSALQQGGPAAMQAAAAAAARQGAAAHPFTSLWRRVTLTLHHAPAAREPQPAQQLTRRGSGAGGEDEGEEEVIIWEKARHKGVHKEELQLLRAGSRPARVTIKLEPDNTPPRFRWAGRRALWVALTYTAL